MSRTKPLMFTLGQGRRIHTWNPVVGCNFNCVYCWARRYAWRWAKMERIRCPKCARCGRKVAAEGIIRLRIPVRDCYGGWVNVELPLCRRCAEELYRLLKAKLEEAKG